MTTGSHMRLVHVSVVQSGRSQLNADSSFGVIRMDWYHVNNYEQMCEQEWCRLRFTLYVVWHYDISDTADSLFFSKFKMKGPFLLKTFVCRNIDHYYVTHDFYFTMAVKSAKYLTSLFTMLVVS